VREVTKRALAWTGPRVSGPKTVSAEPVQASAHKFFRICRAAVIASSRCLHDCGAPAVNNLQPVSSKRTSLDETLAPVPHSGHVAMTEMKCGWEPLTRQGSLMEGWMIIPLSFGAGVIRAHRWKLNSRHAGWSLAPGTLTGTVNYLRAGQYASGMHTCCCKR
jgi:hypothetical protein